MKFLLSFRTYKIIFVCALLAFSFVGKSQMGINSTGALPDASSVLDVSSSTKGFLTPCIDKGYKSVDYARLTPVLVEAIKIQQKQLEDLKSKVSEIK